MSVRKRPQTLMEEDSLHSYKKLATQSQSITRHLEPNLCNNFEVYEAVSADAGLSQIIATIDDSRNTLTGISCRNQAIAQQCSTVINDGSLTGDDAGEVEICLGTLLGCFIACPNGFELNRICFDKAVKHEMRIKEYSIISTQNYYAVASSDRRKFAILDTHNTRILRLIQPFEPIRFQAAIRPKVKSKPTIPAMKTAQKGTVEISINVYGTSTLAKAIGDALSRERKFLQHPDVVEPGVDYVNPQYFMPPGGFGVLNNMIGTRDWKSLSFHTISLEVDRIMDSLTEVDGDVDMLPSSNILTPLLSHQHAALRFIQQREHLSEDDPFKQRKIILLSLHENIEDCQSASPFTRSPGGLLADEVGLGKTLTMLSTIVCSLDEAYRFSSASDPGPLHQDRAKRIRATLVVVPSAQLIEVWKSEIARHISRDSLRVAIFLGSDRINEAEALANFDLVLTTYSTLVKDSQKNGLLHKFQWFRIILDEAHWIRNQKTQQFRAVNSMQADRRWCLTATPIHNRLNDLAALIEFLKIDPFHGKSSKAAFRRYIMDPLTSDIQDRCHNLRVLLRSICLRRTKQSHSPIATFHNKLTLKMNLTERQLYKSILEQAKSELDLQISTLPEVQKYARLFAVLLKLRMVCNLGTSYQDSSAVQSSHSPSIVGNKSDSHVNTDIGCDLCQGKELIDILVEETFCPSCLRLLSDTKKNMSSFPVDRIEQFRSVAEQEYYSYQDSIDNIGENSLFPSITGLGWPTKLCAVANKLAENMCNSKSIVFSCWTSTLDLLGTLLEKFHIPYTRVDGRVSYSERSERLASFQNTCGISVLLMTFGSGALGLNLSSANRIHIVEPQWNPMVEDQAIGRALRLGQKREVTIIRYVMDDTIEQSIVEAQQKKKGLATLVLSGTTKDSMTEKLDELESVLRLR